MLAVVLCCVVLSVTLEVVHGGYQYRPELQRYVAQKKVIATWEEANHICETEGAVLASPIDVALFNYMTSVIGVNNHNTAYFIGVTARRNLHNYTVFMSIEGILLDDMPDDVINIIEYLEPLNGNCLSMDRHGIRVVSCHVRLPYICYKNVSLPSMSTMKLTTLSTTSTSVSTASTLSSTVVETATRKMKLPSDCGSEYTLYSTAESTSCYKLHLVYKTWDEARSVCLSEGADLVVINDKNEAELVQGILAGDYSAWTGVRDQGGRGEWRAVRGDISKYMPPRVPEMYKHLGLDCVGVRKNGLDYYPCSTLCFFICEK